MVEDGQLTPIAASQPFQRLTVLQLRQLLYSVFVVANLLAHLIQGLHMPGE